MKRIVYLLTIFTVISVIQISCKKDVVTPKPPSHTPSAPAEVIETDPPVLKGVTKKLGAINYGYYAGLPAKYNQTTKKYPVILFCHGGGQIGNGDTATELPKLLTEGIGKLLKDKAFPPDFVVNGQHFSFIVLIPQFSQSYSVDDIKNFYDKVKGEYRIDSSRVYVTGFSWGGEAAANFAGNYPSVVPAVVTMGGSASGDLNLKASNIVNNKIALWSFHNEPDEMISVWQSKNFVNAINGLRPSIPARLTIFPTSTAFLKHDCWTKASDPAYKEDGKNIYEWMLQYKK